VILGIFEKFEKYCGKVKKTVDKRIGFLVQSSGCRQKRGAFPLRGQH